MFNENRTIDCMDLAENISALALAIVSDRFLLPEQAFEKLENHKRKNFSLSEEDFSDMVKLSDAGVRNIELVDIYNLHFTMVSRRLKEYRKKTSLAGTR